VFLAKNKLKELHSVALNESMSNQIENGIESHQSLNWC